MSLLREFIQLFLEKGSHPPGRDIPFNYWVRRPRNTLIRDLGDDIEQNRSDIFDEVSGSFDEVVKNLRHKISISNSITDLEDKLLKKGIDAWEIVVDVTQFQSALDNNDLPEVKRQITQGLDKWAQEAVKNAEHDDFSFSTLQGLANLES